MRNILKYSELAKALGVQNASISMAITNKKLIADTANKTIDIEFSVNKFWIDSQIAKGKTFDINRAYNKSFKAEPAKKKDKALEHQNPTQTNNIVTPPPPQENSQSLIKQNQIAELKLQEDLKKVQYSNRLDELKIAKMEGQLIPVDAIKHIFIWASEDFKKTFEQELDTITTIYMQILSGTKEQEIDIKKKLNARLAEIGATMKESLKSGLRNEVNEYADLRSRGERL